MKSKQNILVRMVLACVASIALLIARGGDDGARTRRGRAERYPYGPARELSLIVGRPTGNSIILSVLSCSDIEACVEFGTKPGAYAEKTPAAKVEAGVPMEFTLAPLRPNTRYVYRLRSRAADRPEFDAGPEHTFHTQRAPGSTFVFALQGDSHPERLGKMYHPDLYVRIIQPMGGLDQRGWWLSLYCFALTLAGSWNLGGGHAETKYSLMPERRVSLII